MTNGEKFKEMFGVSQVDEDELYAYAWLPNHNAIEIPPEWWNAEYKEPKTGHWIRVTDKAGHLVWECDKCSWQQRYNTNFCPDCGAKMIESQERSNKE